MQYINVLLEQTVPYGLKGLMYCLTISWEETRDVATHPKSGSWRFQHDSLAEIIRAEKCIINQTYLMGKDDLASNRGSSGEY
jgi:hypothetical protein